MHGMRKKILPIMGLMLALAGCQSASDEMYYDNMGMVNACDGSDCAVVQYSTPNGNDLVLEPAKHVVQIQAQPNVPYSYYVWTGGKSMDSDPDMIVQDGETMILVEE